MKRFFRRERTELPEKKFYCSIINTQEMKRIISTLFFLCLITLGTAQSESAISKIDSIRIQMQELAVKNELSETSKFYSSNAVVNGFDGSLEGIEEIEQYWNNLRGQGVNWEWKDIEYSGSDDYVNQTGLSYLTLRYGDKEITYPSIFSVIWERQKDGGYKIVSDFYRNYVEKESGLNRYTRDSIYIPLEKDSIFGVLFLPENVKAKKIPAVLLLQGGGDVGLSNYLYEARFFAENGIAALVCDKAGGGLSKGQSSWITQTFEEKSEEYFQLIKWLKNQEGIDPDKIGIHGMSEGGRLALDVALRHPKDIAFVNAVSAPVDSFKQNQLYAIYNLLLPRNFDYTVILETLSLWNQYFDEIANRKITKETIERANHLRKSYPDLYLPPDSTDLPRRPQSEDIHYSLGERINELGIPVLFQFGQEDTRVNAMKSISLIPEKPNFDICNYQDTNHSMSLSSGLINPKFLSDKKEWLKNIGMTSE